MEEYKSNSFKSREEKKETTEQPPAERKATPVVNGAKTQKKNEFQKFAEVFVSEDITSVKSYILMDVLVPAIKKAVSDIVTNGVNMILYGESGKPRKNSSPGSKVSYRSYYEEREDDRRRAYTSSGRGFDYDNILFETRADADAVLDKMEDILGQYQVVSVADLFDVAGVPCDNTQAYKYGWTDIRGCKSLRVRDGYVLKLPKALPLN